MPGRDPSWRITADGKVYRKGRKNYPNRDSYDGEFLDVSEIRVPKPLYYCIVDLKAKKDTVVILRDLQSAYPNAQTKELGLFLTYPFEAFEPHPKPPLLDLQYKILGTFSF